MVQEKCDDPSGFTIYGHRGTDEAARVGLLKQDVMRTSPKPKPSTTSARRREAAELDMLNEETRCREFEAVSKARGASNHISEIYSPPRVTELARAMGLQPGFSLDLTAKAPDGRYWDFSRATDRMKAWRLIKSQKPYLLIGSPPCTMFSALQHFNKHRSDREKLMRAAKLHIDFCMDLYRHQLRSGLYFFCTSTRQRRFHGVWIQWNNCGGPRWWGRQWLICAGLV